MHALINEAIKNLDPLVQQKNAGIYCDLDAMNQVLLADRGYILIVLTNILENALKYTSHPKIQVSTSNDNGNFLVSIKDNGKGIESAGLSDRESWGLFGMHERTRRFAGELNISGKAGQGTTLQLRLPLEDKNG